MLSSTNNQPTWKYAINSSTQLKDFTMRNSKCANKHKHKKRSKTGPTLFNGFTNDILDMIDQSCDQLLHNKAL